MAPFKWFLRKLYVWFFFCYSYTARGYKVVTVEAKNNISAKPAQLNYPMTVTDIGYIEVQFYPGLAVSGDLLISTNQNFEDLGHVPYFPWIFHLFSHGFQMFPG